MKIKDRFKILLNKKSKLIAYILICLITILSLTAMPIYMWINSDAETRGIALIRGDSMAPTILDNSVLFVQPTKFERGEIVVAQAIKSDSYSTTNGMALLKRIVGLPGETIEITKDGVLIDGVLLDESSYISTQNESLQSSNQIDEIILSDGEYFLMGDNRADSFDSRHVGAIPRINFMYGLTIEPNEHTKTIISNALVVASINLILIIVIPLLSLIMLASVKKQNGKTKTKRSKKSNNGTNHNNYSSINIKGEFNDIQTGSISSKQQQKSARNKKKAMRIEQTEKEKRTAEYIATHKKRRK